MQSTGHTATQPVSRQSRQSLVMMYAIAISLVAARKIRATPSAGGYPLQPARDGSARAAARDEANLSRMPIRFPSLPFFEALREEMRAARERFSRLGFFDTTFAVRVLDEEGAPLFEGVLGFEVFDCRIV